MHQMFSQQSVGVTSEAETIQSQTMRRPPPCFTVGKAQFSWYSSQTSLPLTHQTTGHGSSNSCSWPGCLQQTVCRLFLWASFRIGFLLGQRPCKPTCCSVWCMVWALTSWPSTSATSKAMLTAVMHLFFQASFCTWRTAQALDPCDACSE